MRNSVPEMATTKFALAARAQYAGFIGVLKSWRPKYDAADIVAYADVCRR